MRPINEVAEDCLKQMKSGEQFTGRDWWEKVVKGGESAARNTAEYYPWLQSRYRVKYSINKYFERKGIPERLKYVGHGEGIRLVKKDKVVTEMTLEYTKRTIRSMKNGSKGIKAFAICEKLSEKDRNQAKELFTFFETSKNYVLVALTKLDLPDDQKRLLWKELGVPIQKRLPGIKNKTDKITAKKKVSMSERKKQLEIFGKLEPNSDDTGFVLVGNIKTSQIIKLTKKAAAYAHVSERTIRRWVKEEGMPRTKDGYYIKKILKIYKETSIAA
jgi:uncharacterized membrane protein YbaN (DUF454 family)